MSFLAPALLYALPLILLPVIIHVLNRMRYRTVPWAAMMFLRRANRKAMRRAKIRHWVVLAVRMLCVFFLIFALSRPMVSGWMGWALTGAPDRIVILLDRSPSMGAKTQDSVDTMLQAGLRQVTAGIQGIGGAQEIVLIDTDTYEPRIIRDINVLSQDVVTQPVVHSGNLLRLLQAGQDHIARRPLSHSQMWLVTDSQASQWLPESPQWQTFRAGMQSLPGENAIKLLQMQPSTKLNRSIEVLRVQRLRRGDRDKLVIQFQVSLNSKTDDAPVSETQGDLPLIVERNGLATTVNFPWEGQQMRLQHQIVLNRDEAGGWGRLRLPADGNPFDNEVFFAYGEAAKQHSLIIADDKSASALLSVASSALGAAAGQAAKVVSWDSMKPGDVAHRSLFVVHSETFPEDKLSLLLGRVEQGAQLVLFAPGQAQRIAAIDLAFGDVATLPDDAQSVNLAMDSDAFWNTLALDTLNAAQYQVPEMDSGTTLVHVGDNASLISGRTLGLGHVYAVGTTLDADWSTLRKGVVLVPWMQHLLSTGSDHLQPVRHLHAAQLTPALRESLLAAKALHDAADPLIPAGQGVWSRESRLSVVNRGITESDTQILDSNVVNSLLGDSLAMQVNQAEDSDDWQSELWRIFVFLMLLAFMVEAVVCKGDVRTEGIRGA